VGIQDVKAWCYQGNALTYGQEAVLPIEIQLDSARVAWQDKFLTEIYGGLMMDMIDEASEGQFRALEGIEKEKARVAKVYNKRVKAKSFQVGDLVWKMIFVAWNQEQSIREVVA
jgi:hypothetical protein